MHEIRHKVCTKLYWPRTCSVISCRQCVLLQEGSGFVRGCNTQRIWSPIGQCTDIRYLKYLLGRLTISPKLSGSTLAEQSGNRRSWTWLNLHWNTMITKDFPVRLENKRGMVTYRGWLTVSTMIGEPANEP